MMNTLAIYQELSGTLGNDAAMKIAAVMGKIYDELKNSVTKDDFNDLRNIVAELAEAQKRTEIKTDENFKSLRDQIAALGSRWGIYNEGMFRATIHGVLKKMPGITVKEGYYGGRQIDVIIRNGEHVMLEITSRMVSGDIDKLYRSADDYFEQEGIQPVLMIATAYISPVLMQKVMGLSRRIDIFSYEPE